MILYEKMILIFFLIYHNIYIFDYCIYNIKETCKVSFLNILTINMDMLIISILKSLSIKKVVTLMRLNFVNNLVKDSKIG